MGNGNVRRPKVVVESPVLAAANLEELRKVADVVVMDSYATAEEWARVVEDAVAIINTKARLTKEILEAASNLRLIARTGVGVDDTKIHLETAAKKGVLITYNPGVNTDAVAELTILLALSLYRKLPAAVELARRLEWGRAQALVGRQLGGKTWGVVGFGRIGSRVAEMARAFGAFVKVYDHHKAEIARSRGFEPADLYTLLGDSDIVSLHVPFTKSTYHMIGEKELSLMKRDAVIINTARGGIIDEGALYRALREGRLAGAALDTLEEEPPKESNPLLSLENVIVTPHIGGSTHEALTVGAQNAVAEVLRFLKGEPPANPYPLNYRPNQKRVGK